MSPFVWMFISSFKDFGITCFGSATIKSLIQLEYSHLPKRLFRFCVFSFCEQPHSSTLIPRSFALAIFKGAICRQPISFNKTDREKKRKPKEIGRKKERDRMACKSAP